MDGIFKTPTRRPPASVAHSSARKSDRWSETVIPESPLLKVIGYGTGIRVSLLERSSPRRGGTYRSPWAVKKLSRRVHVSSTHLQRLSAEASVLRRLLHPCVVGFRGVRPGPLVDSVTLLMEAAGASLMDLIEERQESVPFPLRQMVVVGADIASALHYLHSQHHLLHGDVKSSNVLVFGDFGRAKLCDFGVVVQLDEGLRANSCLYVGTDPWSAPETVDGTAADGVVTDRADVFSYALTLWEMFALEMPHAADLEPMLMEDGEETDADSSSMSDCEKMLEPPPVPVYSQQIMLEYQPFVEIYTVCVNLEPHLRPSADHCAKFFESLLAAHSRS